MNTKNQGAWATGRQKARNGSTNGTMNIFATALQTRVKPQLVKNHSIEFTQALLSKDDNLPSKLNKATTLEKPKPAPRKEDQKTSMNIKNLKVINQMSCQYDNLIVNTRDIRLYNDESAKEDSSFGEITSADEQDLKLLFSGDHETKFAAVEFIKRFVQEKMNVSMKNMLVQKLVVKNEKYKALQKMLCCKSCKKKEDPKAEFRASIKRKMSMTGWERKSGGKTKITYEKKQSAGDIKEDSEDEESNSFSVDSIHSKKDKEADSVMESSHSSALSSESREQATMQVPVTISLEGLKIPEFKSQKTLLAQEKRQRMRKSVTSMSSGHLLEEVEVKRSEIPPDGVIEQKEGSDEEDNAPLSSGFLAKMERRSTQKILDGQGGYLSKEDSQEFDNLETEEPSYLNKAKRFIQKQMTEPTNRNLINFHSVVAFVWYADFILTNLLIGNYWYLTGSPEYSNFLYHQEIYTFILIIQVSDVIKNFFVIVKLEHSELRKPLEIAQLYLSKNFPLDVIALLPYHNINKKYIFIRLIKVKHWKKIEKYFDNFFIQHTENCLSNDIQKQVIDFFSLAIMIILISHFFACIWVLIGLDIYENQYEKGWIYVNHSGGIQNLDFKSLYISAIYWVYTTFSSVGYGDIKGDTAKEYLFQMLVELIGMGFFGYMTGTLQQILLGFAPEDLKAVQNETIDYWMMSMSRARQNSMYMPLYIFKGVREYFNQAYRHNAMMIQYTDEYQRLKPRLQKQISDLIYQSFYDLFKEVFLDTEPDFKRQIIALSSYKHVRIEDQEQMDDYQKYWFAKKESCVFQPAGEKSKYVYFIISGKIHIMNKEGILEYGVLGEGSYFGDLSVMSNEPNEFAYYIDPYSGKANEFLQIEGEVFKQVLTNFPLSKSIFELRAKNRQNIFNSYKAIAILKIMKCARTISSKIIKGMNINALERVILMNKLDVRLRLCDHFYQVYTINRKIRLMQNNNMKKALNLNTKREAFRKVISKSKNSVGAVSGWESINQSIKNDQKGEGKDGKEVSKSIPNIKVGNLEIPASSQKMSPICEKEEYQDEKKKQKGQIFENLKIRRRSSQQEIPSKKLVGPDELHNKGETASLMREVISELQANKSFSNFGAYNIKREIRKAQVQESEEKEKEVGANKVLGGVAPPSIPQRQRSVLNPAQMITIDSNNIKTIDNEDIKLNTIASKEQQSRQFPNFQPVQEQENESIVSFENEDQICEQTKKIPEEQKQEITQRGASINSLVAVQEEKKQEFIIQPPRQREASNAGGSSQEVSSRPQTSSLRQNVKPTGMQIKEPILRQRPKTGSERLTFKKLKEIGKEKPQNQDLSKEVDPIAQHDEDEKEEAIEVKSFTSKKMGFEGGGTDSDSDISPTSVSIVESDQSDGVTGLPMMSDAKRQELMMQKHIQNKIKGMMALPGLKPHKQISKILGEGILDKVKKQILAKNTHSVILNSGLSETSPPQLNTNVQRIKSVSSSLKINNIGEKPPGDISAKTFGSKENSGEQSKMSITRVRSNSRTDQSSGLLNTKQMKKTMRESLFAQRMSVQLDKTLLKHKFEWDNKGNMKKPRVSNAQLSHLLMQERKEVAKINEAKQMLIKAQENFLKPASEQSQNESISEDNEDKSVSKDTLSEYSSLSESETSSQYLDRFNKAVNRPNKEKHAGRIEDCTTVRQLEKYKNENQKQIKKLLHDYFYLTIEKEKKEEQTKQKIQEKAALKQKWKIVKKNVRSATIVLDQKAKNLMDVKQIKQDYEDDSGSNSYQESTKTVDQSAAKKDEAIGEQENAYLNIIINEYINLPTIKYQYFKHNRDMRLSNAQDDIAFEDYQRKLLMLTSQLGAQTAYDPIIEALPRQKIKKTIPQELIETELKEEIAACEEDDPQMKTAILQEYKIDKQFEEIKSSNIGELKKQIQSMKDKFDRQIRELQDKVEERKEQEDECLNLNV